MLLIGLGLMALGAIMAWLPMFHPYFAQWVAYIGFIVLLVGIVISIVSASARRSRLPRASDEQH